MFFDLIKASLGALVFCYFNNVFFAKHTINYGNFIKGNKKFVFLIRLRVTKGTFFSESEIRFSNLPKKNIPKKFPELEI